MGNRAVITTAKREIGVYLHWNGGRDSVEPLLKYCELQGYRPPDSDSYGWARLCQVAGNFFGGSLCVGIGLYDEDETMDPGDNGIYVIEGWSIAERLKRRDFDKGGMRAVEPCEEQQEHDFDDMLRLFDESMPENERLRGFLDSVEVPLDEVSLGDEVWMRETGGKWTAFPVVGFGQPPFNRIPVYTDAGNGRTAIAYPDFPYVARYCHDGDYSWNSNNYVHGDTARITPRK